MPTAYGYRGLPQFAASLNQHDAKWAAIFQASSDHLPITLLEDMQGWRSPREEDALEREEGKLANRHQRSTCIGGARLG